MSAVAIVIRPEPGAAATAARLRGAGVEPFVAPLFAPAPLAWDAPDPAGFDRLLLTSANAARHGGAALARYHRLPCWCVGAATAKAAMAAGLQIAAVGEADAASLLARSEAGGMRWLWLAGAAHMPLSPPAGATLTIVPVYMMAEQTPSPALIDALARPAVLLAHSAAAARRLATLVADKTMHDLVAISPATAAAAGAGWGSITVAARPDDAEMVAIAAALCQKARHERSDG